MARKRKPHPPTHPFVREATRRINALRASGVKQERKANRSLWPFLLSLESEPLRAAILQKMP